MRRIERYLVHERIAEGGMASVFLGTLRGEGRFKRPVAIKEMQPHLARQAEFRDMFLDEARTVSRIRHANVVSTLDVLSQGDELFLVMEYVHGPTLAHLLRAVVSAGETIPLDVAVRVLIDVLAGLQAAHDATRADGSPLGVVHRDVSPHNVLLDADGRALVMDFGIATAADRSHSTKTGEVKGKAAYMAPEQARATGVDRRADVWAAGVVAFELFTLTRPFGTGSLAEVLSRSLFEPAPPLGSLREDAPGALEAAVAVALSKEPEARFASARDFADALEAAVAPASHAKVGEWVKAHSAELLASRDAAVARALAAEEAATTSVTLAETPPTSRSRAPFVAAAGIVFLLGVGATVWGLSRPSPTPALVAISPSLASAPPSAPASTTSAATAPASAPPLASTTPTSPVVASRPSAKPLASSVASAASNAASAVSSAAPKRPCCIRIGETMQRYAFADCVDNCPPGTP